MAKTNKLEAPTSVSRPYIKSVRLRNVPPLRDVKANFKLGLNIIIGKNGSGKTNFMKLLSQLSDLDELKYKGAGCELVIGRGEKDLTVTFEEQLLSQTKPSRKKDKHVTYRISTGPPSLIVVAKAEGEIRESAFFSEVIGSLLSDYSGYAIIPIWHGMPAHRLLIVDEAADLSYNDAGGMQLTNMPQEAWQRGSVLERALIDSLVPFDIGSPANQFIATDLEKIRNFVTQGINAQLEQLNNFLPIHSPLQAVRLSQQFQVYRNTANDELLLKGLSLEYQIADDWLPFTALSDGTKRIFYLMSELVTVPNAFWNQGYTSQQAAADYPDRIILLEEPELGIHPEQLHKLMQLIREVSRENQIILTTHSPQVLDVLTEKELNRITICEYVSGKGTQMRKLSAAKLTKAKFYLRDEGFLSEFWRFSNLEDPD